MLENDSDEWSSDDEDYQTQFGTVMNIAFIIRRLVINFPPVIIGKPQTETNRNLLGTEQ